MNRDNTGCSPHPSPSRYANNGTSLAAAAASPVASPVAGTGGTANRNQTQKYHLEVHIRPKELSDWSP